MSRWRWRRFCTRPGSVPAYNHYYPHGDSLSDPDEGRRLLALHGPTIPVTVGVTAQQAARLGSQGITPPEPIPGLALIDTGASVCVVDELVLERLAIPPFGYQTIAGVTGNSTQATYPAGLGFPGTPISPIVFQDFVGSRLSALGIIVLIGRNVLSNFVLVYNGPGGHVSLAF